MTTFADPKYYAYFKDLYVGNECDTDEYGEAYPRKGLEIIASISTLLEAKGETDGLISTQGDEDLTFYGAVRAWFNAEPETGRYVGADEFVPIAGYYFDLLWNDGKHPYVESFEEWVDGYHDGDMAAFEQDVQDWQARAAQPAAPTLCALCERPMGPGDDQQTQQPGTPYCGDCWNARGDDGAYLRGLA